MENINNEELNKEVEIEETEIEETPECTEIVNYDYDDEPEEDSTLGNVLAGVAVAGATVVTGIVLKKYGPKIKGWVADKRAKHAEKKEKKAIAYLVERGVSGEQIDLASAEKIVDAIPVEEPVKVDETKEEKKDTKKK